MSKSSALTDEEREVDAYGLLDITSAATEKDIQRAYRKKSLKYHPDKNPSPDAVPIFHSLNIALAMLLDPGKRLFLDTRLEKERVQRARFAEMDKKRQAGIDDLLRREEDAKKARVEQSKQAAHEQSVRNAGRALVEEAQRKAREAAMAARAPPAAPAASTSRASRQGMPDMSAADLTLRLQLPSSSSLTTTNLEEALARYGSVAGVALRDRESAKEKEGKKRKGPLAYVEFARGNWGGCWACWKDHEAGKGVEAGAKVKWAGGTVPDWVAWAEQQAGTGDRRTAHGTTSVSAANGHDRQSASAAAAAEPFSSAPDLGRDSLASLLDRHASDRKQAAEQEDMTLFRMRQRERDRLAEQIRREEEEDA